MAHFLVVVFVPEGVVTETIAETKYPRSLLEVENEVEVVVEHLLAERGGYPDIGVASFVACGKHKGLLEEWVVYFCNPPRRYGLKVQEGNLTLRVVKSGFKVEVCSLAVEGALVCGREFAPT